MPLLLRNRSYADADAYVQPRREYVLALRRRTRAVASVRSDDSDTLLLVTYVMPQQARSVYARDCR